MSIKALCKLYDKESQKLRLVDAFWEWRGISNKRTINSLSQQMNAALKCATWKKKCNSPGASFEGFLSSSERKARWIFLHIKHSSPFSVYIQRLAYKSILCEMRLYTTSFCVWLCAHCSFSFSQKDSFMYNGDEKLQMCEWKCTKSSWRRYWSLKHQWWTAEWLFKDLEREFNFFNWNLNSTKFFQ